MDRKDLLNKMKEGIGTKDPLEYFSSMIDVFNLLFDKLEKNQEELEDLRNYIALSISWDALVANDMIVRKIEFLRNDKETYHAEISELKKAAIENQVTQNYNDFCQFWIKVLGYHPFLKY